MSWGLAEGNDPKTRVTPLKPPCFPPSPSMPALGLNSAYCREFLSRRGCALGDACTARHDIQQCSCGLVLPRTDYETHKRGKRHRNLVAAAAEASQGQRDDLPGGVGKILCNTDPALIVQFSSTPILLKVTALKPIGMSHPVGQRGLQRIGRIGSVFKTYNWLSTKPEKTREV